MKLSRRNWWFLAIALGALILITSLSLEIFEGSQQEYQEIEKQ